jgi:hypothetical protein
MLIVVESRDGFFVGKTVVLAAEPTQTVARLKSRLLHILHDAGRDGLTFRLRFRGAFLKDVHLLEEYGIVDRAHLELIVVGRPSSARVRCASMTTTP